MSVLTPEARQAFEQAKTVLIEKGWTKGAYARDESGKEVDFDSPEAACFCIFGAMLRVTDGNPTPEMYDAMGLQLEKGFITFNDNANTKKEDVIAIFDKILAKS